MPLLIPMGVGRTIFPNIELAHLQKSSPVFTLAGFTSCACLTLAFTPVTKSVCLSPMCSICQHLFRRKPPRGKWSLLNRSDAASPNLLLFLKIPTG